MSEATSDSCPKREQHGTGFQPPPRAALSRTEDQPGWRRGQSVPFPGPPYSRYRAAALKSKGSCPLPRGPRVLGLMTAGGSCATTSFPAAGSPGWDFLAPILFPLTGWRIQTPVPVVLGRLQRRLSPAPRSACCIKIVFSLFMSSLN